MPRKTLTPEQAQESLRRRYEYTTKRNAEKYDRLVVNAPKGTKDRIKATGYGITEYVLPMVLDKLDDNGV